MSSSAWITLAHVVRPQGRRGEVIAELLTDFPEKFAERKRVFVAREEEIASAPREMELADYRLMQNRVVLHFTGVDSIEAAETLRGYDVVIPESERAPLEDDAAYISDLIGCEVWDAASGRRIGVVCDVDREATNVDLLVVEQDGGRTAEIPFVKDFLVKLDVTGQRIEMRLPDGLLDINTSTAAPRHAKAPREKKHKRGKKPHASASS